MLSKGLLLIAVGLLSSSIFFPLWRIELDAPQYPEGLVLQLFVDKIGGDVEIINGLNHYIGMKTLHTEDFFEFTILRYIILFFAFLALVVLLAKQKKWLYTLFILFIAFGVLAAADFYRWNYEYGHNLDPNAAIKVPGMAYTPPLLGYKQLLNFGAYSIPDKGGWMLLGAGLLFFIATLKESNIMARFKKSKRPAMLVLLFFSVMQACTVEGPQPIKLNSESCAFCKMTIADGRFGAEVLTAKGRYYKFDDISCMAHYVNYYSTVNYRAYYVHDYLGNNMLMPVNESYFLSGGKIMSPMQGNVAAFRNESIANEYAEKLNATPITWDDILNLYQ